LEGERAGAGLPLVLLHGLTATRRYVLMGSRYLARAGCELIGFDARGHGRSSPAPSRERYEYDDMVRDLEAVAADVGGPVVLAGNSMGAATAVAHALRNPGGVEAMVVITPGFSGGARGDREMGDWERLADGLERGGVDGFMEAYEPPAPSPEHPPAAEAYEEAARLRDLLRQKEASDEPG